MNRRIQFELQERTLLQNQWQRMHRYERARYTKSLSWSVRVALQAGGWRRGMPVMERCKIEIYRYSTQHADWDGLFGGIKPLLDCLVVCTKRNPHGLGVIRDDSPQHLRCPTVNQIVGGAKVCGTVVSIQEVSEIQL